MTAMGTGTTDASVGASERLAGYAALLRKWAPAINLVARSTLDDLESRHFADSAQLFDLAPENPRHWVDLGSGAGFPGLVVAILAADRAPKQRFTLIESDQRKGTFLRTVIRELALDHVEVHARRIEDTPPQDADVVSARAVAPLAKLLCHAERHLGAHGVALFPKGARYQQELDEALASWRCRVQKIPSKTDPEAVILKIGGIARV